jgi:hypothetical protein
MSLFDRRPTPDEAPENRPDATSRPAPANAETAPVNRPEPVNQPEPAAGQGPANAETAAVNRPGPTRSTPELRLPTPPRPGAPAPRAASPDTRDATGDSRADVHASRLDEPASGAEKAAGRADEPVVATPRVTQDAGAGASRADADRNEQTGPWRQVLMEFVDHPREAVEKADRLLDEALRSLTERVDRERRGLRDAWHTHGEPSTEDLRRALRGYRDLFEKVLGNR